MCFELNSQRNFFLHPIFGLYRHCLRLIEYCTIAKADAKRCFTPYTFVPRQLCLDMVAMDVSLDARRQPSLT